MADESGEPQQQSGIRVRERQARDEQVVRKQRRAVFRVPSVSLLTIPILLFCITPIAFSVPGLQLLYLIPVAVVVWVLRVRTIATSEGLTARALTTTRSIPWDDLSGLSVTEKAAIRAALTDGTTVALPYVRLHHVPVLSLLSDGRIPDPSGALAGDMTSDSPATADSGATADSHTESDDTTRPATPA
ncbi:PH domain-containing protein [Prauserella halophila]|uniref:PH domain-containing protein n=1 Tax=Prauserella halophila TaxID=185641 RepID=A0ABN1WD06_9PSEU|nr:PH domain-containing protein [Prauserella halophila]MCP2235121.1 PH domain-containing protein [Prauserella halophila]